MRKFVTSDTHGEEEKLRLCLELAGFNYEKDLLIHLGDVCDRGFSTHNVIELLLTIKNLISIRGNHDEWFLQYCKTGSHPSPGSFNETMMSYRQEGCDYIPKSHIKFLEDQRLCYLDEENRFFCHAGFDPQEFIEAQDEFELYWDRDLIKKALSAKAGGVNLNDINGFKQIFIGHTPTITWKKNGKRINTPIYAAQVVNIDTGAPFKEGKLSVIDITTDNHILYQI